MTGILCSFTREAGLVQGQCITPKEPLGSVLVTCGCAMMWNFHDEAGHAVVEWTETGAE